MAPPRALKDESVLRRWRSFSEYVADPRHAGEVAGADRAGHGAGPEGVAVAIGVWLDRLGRVRRARWTASGSSDALVAYAEFACGLLESGVAPASLDADALRRLLSDVPHDERQHADVVAAAIAGALCSPLLP